MLFGELPLVSTMLQAFINSMMNRLSSQISVVLRSAFCDAHFKYFGIRITWFLFHNSDHLFRTTLIISMHDLKLQKQPFIKPQIIFQSLENSIQIFTSCLFQSWLQTSDDLEMFCPFQNQYYNKQINKMMINREAYEEPNIPIKVKNKFINLLFQNRQLEEVTYRKTIGCFVIIFLIFLGLSIFFFVAVSQVVEVRQKYYDPGESNCTIGMNCTVSFSVPTQMSQPVYFMYELGNFYQNHRRYIQSKSNYQLAGNDITTSQAQNCYPFITNSDMGNTNSWNGTLLNSSQIASPCGAIAYTFFNDTFQLYNGFNTSAPEISINQQGISWDGDQGQKFRRSNSSQSSQWIDPQDEHFIVWMRTSGLPNFKKPWGRIESDVPVGNYTVVISNNYDSSQSNGNRYFILTTLSIVGGRNFILPITFMVISMLSLTAVVFFCRRFRSLKNIGSIRL